MGRCRKAVLNRLRQSEHHARKIAKRPVADPLSAAPPIDGEQIQPAEDMSPETNPKPAIQKAAPAKSPKKGVKDVAVADWDFETCEAKFWLDRPKS